MKIRLISIALAVGIFAGCQTQTVMLRASRDVEPQPVDVKMNCDKCKTDIKFGPNPGDGGVDINFGPGPGDKKKGLLPPKYMRQRSYA